MSLQIGWLVASALLVLSACATTSVPSRAETLASSCADPRFREMDFWVGEWEVQWDATPSLPAGVGRNTVTRELGVCVIQERFEGGPATQGLVGHSVSTFHRQVGQWRQTWVDNKGGYFALVGGRQGDQFVLESTRISEQMPQVRMVFEDITDTSLTWRWQRSTDGGATWADEWVIYYSRIAS
ncbi:MAG: hypothetical protein AB7Q23_10110 [Hyphomonadaceae bacterium]